MVVKVIVVVVVVVVEVVEVVGCCSCYCCSGYCCREVVVVVNLEVIDVDNHEDDRCRKCELCIRLCFCV